jgi:hypothetical protein
MGHACATLRGFLRYLQMRGLLATDLSAQVTTPRIYSLETLPRALDWEDVERAVHAVARHTVQGRRESARLVLRRGLSYRALAGGQKGDRRAVDSDLDRLVELASPKPKNLPRERRRVHEAGIEFRVLSGHQLNPGLWSDIMPLYANTFWRRGREPYLTRDFFTEIGARLPNQLVVILAELHKQPVAAAICFRSHDTLYGRYWGSLGRYHSLHFETCYYQGIDYCIAHQLKCFEPGTQGEHKISRGFVPTETWSAHWLSHPQFASAIDEYLHRERDFVDQYIDAASGHVPFRQRD